LRAVCDEPLDELADAPRPSANPASGDYSGRCRESDFSSGAAQTEDGIFSPEEAESYRERFDSRGLSIP